MTAAAAVGASAGAGAGGLAEKLLQRKLDAERWNSSGQAAPAASADELSSADNDSPAATAASTGARVAADVSITQAGKTMSKAEKRAARDKKRAEAFHARKLAQEQQEK